MATFLPLLSLATLLTIPADTVTGENAYVRTADAIINDSATMAFLRRNDSTNVSPGICVADSLSTLDRFPFDAYPGDSVVSVFKADMLRPVRSSPTEWPARLRRVESPAGILFISRQEGRTILAELFFFDPGYRSYEEYCITSDSLKFLLQVGRGGRVTIAGRVRLLR